MYKQSITNLSKLKKGEVKQFLNSLDNVLTDCDGVLWVADKPIENVSLVFNRLREMGKRIFFVTNNSTRSRDKVANKLKNLNYKCTIDEIITSGYLTAQYLKATGFNKKVYIIGHSGIATELDLVGIKHSKVGPDIFQGDVAALVRNVKIDPKVGAVIVGYDERISFPKMLKAATYLKNPDCLFIGTNTDPKRSSKPHLGIPAAGTIVAMISASSPKKPLIIGKPSVNVTDFLIKQHKVDPKRSLMIGDNCYTDILLGTRSGFQTLLVLSGVTSLEEVMQLKETKQEGLIPDVYLQQFSDLMEFLD